MAEKQTALVGHCLCGAVTITVDGSHDPAVGACHCRMCQRWSGGLFLCFSVAADAMTVNGPVKRYVSSRIAERAFCETCGSHLWMHDVAPGSGYDLMPGLFDEAVAWPLRSEIYSDRALASVRLEGGHPRATGAEYENSNPRILGDTP